MRCLPQAYRYGVLTFKKQSCKYWSDARSLAVSRQLAWLGRELPRYPLSVRASILQNNGCCAQVIEQSRHTKPLSQLLAA